MRRRVGPRRRLLVPEVIQTSAMDCGPAALKSLLAGCGVQVSYARLREACQTSLDGTSIDTLEDLANELGLVAEQTLIPVDHLGLDEAGHAPAVMVVSTPGGGTHFVVLWASHGPVLQVMDPSRGRRWCTTESFAQSLYLHSQSISTTDWCDWASADEFKHALRERLRRLGVSRGEAHALHQTARAEGDAVSLATLDAAARMASSLVAERQLARGTGPVRLVRALVALARERPDEALETIPERFWFARPEAGGITRVRGTVVLQVRTHQPREEPSSSRTADPESVTSLAAELQTRERHPLAMVADLLRDDGWWPALGVLSLAVLASLGVFVETVIFRGLLEVIESLRTPGQRIGAAVYLLVFFFLLLALAATCLVASQRLGRRVEARMRLRYFEKLARLDDVYFRTRLPSDMAERCHMLVFLRRLPDLAVSLIRSMVEVMLYAAGLVWLDPNSAFLVILTAAFAALGPFVFQPMLGEAEMRVRSQQGALSRFYLDALHGLLPLRVHGAERAFIHQHEEVLGEWYRAGLRLARRTLTVDGVLALVTTILTGKLVFQQLTQGSGAGPALLTLYWSLQLPAQAAVAAMSLRQYPAIRNVLLRVAELTHAPDAVDQASPKVQVERPFGTSSSPEGPVSLSIEGVDVIMAGQRLLEDVTLAIPAGEHVAIVGKSGAGKSSLIGVLLGWHQPARGRVLVDGRPLTRTEVLAVRETTAWVDPAVQLWNDTLLANLTYGSTQALAQPLRTVLEEADVEGLVHRLPEGLRTSIGEAGGKLSGGEGQRVRIGRALLRERPRLVLLDEPFRGLARAQREELLQRIRVRCADATLLCVSHDITMTRDFDRVILIDEGRVVEDGSPSELLARVDGAYARLNRQDETAQSVVWSNGSWRRWRMNLGRLEEHNE